MEGERERIRKRKEEDTGRIIKTLHPASEREVGSTARRGREEEDGKSRNKEYLGKSRRTKGENIERNRVRGTYDEVSPYKTRGNHTKNNQEEYRVLVSEDR